MEYGSQQRDSAAAAPRGTTKKKSKDSHQVTKNNQQRSGQPGWLPVCARELAASLWAEGKSEGRSRAAQASRWLDQGATLVFEASYGGRHHGGAAGIAFDGRGSRSPEQQKLIEAATAQRYRMHRIGGWAILGQHRGQSKAARGTGYAVLTHSFHPMVPSIPRAEINRQLERLIANIEAGGSYVILRPTKGPDPEQWARLPEQLSHEAARRCMFLEAKGDWSDAGDNQEDQA